MVGTARNISRRSLVSGAVATGVLGSCAATRAFADEAPAAAPAKWDAAMPEAWDREVGVVIAGTGIAGASAAVEAFDAGMDVLVLTATDDIIDCSCTISGGALSGCCTSLQEDEGIEDSVEAFIRDIRADGGDFGDLECVTAWAENSGDTVDWLIDLGCEVNSMVMQPESHSVARSYNSLPAGNGLGWMEGLKGAIEERGVEVIYSTPVTRIYREADGRVVGIEATPKDGSGPINVKATQGIIMATGGIGSNVDLPDQYYAVMRRIEEEAKAGHSRARPGRCERQGHRAAARRGRLHRPHGSQLRWRRYRGRPQQAGQRHAAALQLEGCAPDRGQRQRRALHQRVELLGVLRPSPTATSPVCGTWWSLTRTAA